jgi:hypothetical protein
MKPITITSNPRARHRMAVIAGKLAVGFALVWSAMNPLESEAQVMFEPGTTLPGTNYIQYGIQSALGRSVWIKGQTTSNTIVYFTGGRYDGWNVLTVNPFTHSASTGPVTILQVGNGSNFLTDPGDVVNVSGVVVNPGHDQSVVHLSSFLPGIDMTLGGAPSPLNPVRIGGYGSFAILDGAINPSDGSIRAFDMLKGTDNSPTALHMTANLMSYVQHPGGALGGFSGSPVVDESTGFSFGAVISVANGLGTGAIQVNFFEPYDPNFILQNVNVVLAIAPVTNTIVLTWSAAATGWRLQTSSNLTTWSNLLENLPGPGSFTDPIASRPQQFYRLVKP